MRGRSGRQQAVGAQVGDCPSALPAVASVTSASPLLECCKILVNTPQDMWTTQN